MTYPVSRVDRHEPFNAIVIVLALAVTALYVLLM